MIAQLDAVPPIPEGAATLREEVVLSQLRKHLLSVVQETMQPMHVSLWLRESEHKSKSNTER